MGRNKAFIEIEGTPIIKRICSLFERLFEEVIIVTNEEEPYKALGAKVYNDLFPNVGVLGGLYTGLFFSSFAYSFCVASDMPFLKVSVIDYLIRGMEDYDVIVPKTRDGLQPLHALYSKNCLEPIRVVMSRKNSRVVDFYPMVRTRIIDDFELASVDPGRESFINVNTPEELLLIK